MNYKLILPQTKRKFKTEEEINQMVEEVTRQMSQLSEVCFLEPTELPPKEGRWN